MDLELSKNGDEIFMIGSFYKEASDSYETRWFEYYFDCDCFKSASALDSNRVNQIHVWNKE